MTTTVPTRTPDDVLATYDAYRENPANGVFPSLTDLASALRATLAELSAATAAYDRSVTDAKRIAVEKEQLRTKLEKAKAVVEAARQARHAVCIIGLERDALDRALAAYDKDDRNAPDD